MSSCYLSGISIGDKDHVGITWGPAEVVNAFGFLTNVVEELAEFPPATFTEPPVPEPDPPHRIILDDTEKIARDTLYSEGPSIKWLKSDYADMRAETDGKKPFGASWYARLREVADATMQLLLALHYGIPDENHVCPKWTHEFATQQVQRTITAPPRGQKGRSIQFLAYQPFPIDKGISLSMWRQSYEESGLLERASTSHAAAGIESLRRDERMPLSIKQLATAKKHSETTALAPIAAMRQAYEPVAGAPEATVAQFGSISSYPMYPIAPPQLDPFMLAFASINLHSQVALMEARLKNEYLRLAFLGK
jgi:hypothetical protein